MKTMDTENSRLDEWLQMLGCPVALTSVDLQRLNTPRMRSVWRHLQSHVLRVSSVQTVRRNLLLSKLQKQNIFPGKFANFKIQSVQELFQVQDISDKYEEIKCLKDSLKAVDGNLQNTTFTLLAKFIEKEKLRHNIKENEDKTVFLQLYLARIQKDINKINTEVEKAHCLMIPHNTMSSSDMSHNKSVVVNYVKKLWSSSSNGIDHDALSDMIESTLEFSATTIFNGILYVSNQAFKSLNKCKANLDISNSSRIHKNPANSDILEFSKHLSHLNFLVFQSELDRCTCLEKIRDHSSKLEQDKATLTTHVEEICGDNSCVDDELNAVEFVNTLVGNAITSKKVKTLKELKEELEADCTSFDFLKSSIEELGAKEKTLHEKVNKKVSDINSFISTIRNSKVDVVKADVHKSCTEQVSNFLSKLKFNNEENESLFSSYESIIGKEVEMFQKEPLCGILRRWEEPCEMLPNNVVQDLPENSLFMCLLQQSQPKNILKSILEQLCWSHTINY